MFDESTRYVSTNQCVNLWHGELGAKKWITYDVYIIFPESMGALTAEDIFQIETLITPIIEDVAKPKALRKEMIKKKLMDLPLEDYGWVVYGDDDLPSQMYKICFYADETGLYTEEECNANNITYLDVPAEIVEEYFSLNYMGDSWEDTYTADDTIELLEFAREREWIITRY